MVFRLVRTAFDSLTQGSFMGLSELVGIEEHRIRSWRDYASEVGIRIKDKQIDLVTARIIIEPSEEYPSASFVVVYEANKGATTIVHKGNFGSHDFDPVDSYTEPTYRSIQTVRHCLDRLKSPADTWPIDDLVSSPHMDEIREINLRHFTAWISFNGRHVDDESLELVARTCDEREWQPYDFKSKEYEAFF